MAPTVPEGSVFSYQTKSGRRWGFVIDAPGPDGQRRQAKRRGYRLERDAKAALDDFRAELRLGRVPVPDDGTVAGFTAGWLAALPAEGLERSTIKYYSEAVRRLLPTIGDLPLQALTGQDIDRAYAALRLAGRTARTIRASHAAISKMLAEAVRMKKAGHNAAVDARPPRAKSAKPKRFPTWDIEGLALFLDATAESPDAAMWWTAGFTGMRRGEFVALRWAAVDLDRGVVRVERAMAEAGGKEVYEKVPKSDAGHRLVELDDDTIDVLRRHRRSQLERRVAIGPGWRDTGLVFCEVDGAAVAPNRATERWRQLVKQAPTLGLPVIRLHDLRHSHATQLLAAGVRPDVVTERLGHSSVAFTLSQYGHVYEGDQRAAMNQLAARRRAMAEASGRREAKE